MQGIVVTEEIFEWGFLVGHWVWHFGSVLFSSNLNLFVIDDLNVLLGVDNFNVTTCNCPYMADLVVRIRAINVRHYMIHSPWKLHTKGMVKQWHWGICIYEDPTYYRRRCKCPLKCPLVSKLGLHVTLIIAELFHCYNLWNLMQLFFGRFWRSLTSMSWRSLEHSILHLIQTIPTHSYR